MAAIVGGILAISGIAMYIMKSMEAQKKQNKFAEREKAYQKRGLTSLSMYKDPSHEITDPHQVSNNIPTTSVKNKKAGRYGIPNTHYASDSNVKVMVGHSYSSNDPWRESM
jgi:hypothetical protein